VVNINSALLALVREYRGLTQTELADRLGLTQGYISKLENRLLDPSEEGIERLADALDWPVGFFYRPDRVYGFGTACMYHRKRASLPVHALRSVQATVNVVRIALAPMVREIEIEAPPFPQLDADEYDADPERIAQLVRGTWRLPLGPVTDLTRTIEAAGGIVYRVDFGTRLLDAVSHWAPDMPPLFFVNTEAPGDRVRFSLAHELGHVIMHAAPTRDMEREADQFASQFLMPRDEIGSSLHGIDLARAAQLKPYWKVSMAALIVRARDLGYINRQRASRLFMQLSSLGYRTVEPVPIAHEEPVLLKKIMSVWRDVHGFSVDDLVALSGIPAPDFHNYQLADMPHLRSVK
jgi:Zn-dependent peptidase ImmA (M78 family)/DNA-binding XRE family transcriptional regulator